MSSRWNLLWAIPWMLVTWLSLELLVWLPLYLLGIPALWMGQCLSPILLMPSIMPSDPMRLGFTWKWLDWWVGNFEDGLLPDWWKDLEGTYMTWFLRNPVTNLRFVPIISTKPDADKIRWCGTLDYVPHDDTSRGWFVCWQGPYVGFLYQGSKWGCWFGWKVSPDLRIVDNSPDRSYRYWGIGTAAHIWKVE